MANYNNTPPSPSATSPLIAPPGYHYMPDGTLMEGDNHPSTLSVQTLNLNKNLINKGAYSNVIDTSFSQLLPPPPPVEDTITVNEFFDYYLQLFYDIPEKGENNSHEFLIKRSSEYVGVSEVQTNDDFQVLLDEITTLRQNLLNTEQELLESTSKLAETQQQLRSLESQTLGRSQAPTNTANPG